MSSAVEKATILVECLPYIQRFHGKTVVIKYGGNAMINEELKNAVINDIILMQLVGMRPVIVHGGGPEINQMLDKVDVKSEFINGLRVTDAETMNIVQMVLVGKVNADLVSQVNTSGGHAVGLSGKDGFMIKTKKQAGYIVDDQGQKKSCDLGFVGEIVNVDIKLITSLMDQGYLPIISPIGMDEKGQSYNINADTVAGRVAGALKAEKLVLLTDVEGIYSNADKTGEIISSLKVDEVKSLIEEGVIAGGMIPKVKCCMDALSEGVISTHILDGRQPHSILLEVFTREGIGTMVQR